MLSGETNWVFGLIAVREQDTGEDHLTRGGRRLLRRLVDSVQKVLLPWSPWRLQSPLEPEDAVAMVTVGARGCCRHGLLEEFSGLVTSQSPLHLEDAVAMVTLGAGECRRHGHPWSWRMPSQ
ncbi:hypothetical protein NHX12_034232 [Muraenolepis orangiensis]|uniref:Uncharacterized protein n=1 Tax=Muraenolepis orangiensis TaxID=630683 RepID=A0A9Q0D579_9TELE|nr:hypothetical protein NHX12_034232 [Muraenolepis orangiensis]